MRPPLSRRDFLKLTGLLPLSLAAPPFVRALVPAQPPQVGKNNVLVIVFDAFSAYHIPFHGYARETIPNIARLAERAIVYHNHFAGGNFTSPGTASLLTGVLPWKHRAFKFYSTVDEAFADKSIFHAFKDYYRIAYSHNPLVKTLFDQFAPSLDEYIPLEQFLLTNDGLIQSLFHNDDDIAAVSWARFIKKEEDNSSYSLFLSDLYRHYQDRKIADLKPSFPLGLPNVKGDNYFTLEMAMDWLGTQVGRIPRPFLGYFHFMPPHQPYRTRLDFYNHFEHDGWTPPDKPEDMFAKKNSSKVSLKRRKQYDEFILYVDREFGKFFDRLESSRLLEDTWVILTSDHGELFERGIVGHVTPVLYQPVIRVPLLVFEPGRKTRTDIYSPTSAVDLLPTLLHVTGGARADWTEGEILPPFSSEEPERSIFAMQAKDNEKHTPLTRATLTLVKGRYKLMYLFGYEELRDQERIELYDIEQDPEELVNLYRTQNGIGKELLDELKTKLAEMNKPYL